jgi:hypothetical protein
MGFSAKNATGPKRRQGHRNVNKGLTAMLLSGEQLVIWQLLRDVSWASKVGNQDVGPTPQSRTFAVVGLRALGEF